MKEYKIYVSTRVATQEELSLKERELIREAVNAAESSYSPYSHFAVGAALRLDTGEIIKGSNQENASYPVGCCAERTALFWTGANRKHAVICEIAVVALNGGQITRDVTAPCGMCRQALLEVERRQKIPIRVFLCGKDEVVILNQVADLLPLSFNAENMSV